MKNIRVRFAPSPTGMMHLGNVRSALINFLFAQQKQGTFVLRIEDTDAQRMFDVDAKNILEDLQWLNLEYNEGPGIGGPHAPYFQSQRMGLYEKQRKDFEDKNLIYRCFCTEDELNRKRERQQALKMPPRYDRACLALSPAQVEEKLLASTPFIWRFKLDHNRSVTITDLAHGKTTFELRNFSDFPITRQDGSYTFMFANFVDDYLMEITHVFRGEDHLSNTANQAAMFDALSIPLPIYWHMPILCNTEGKKLSKRDFGFSLRDLKNAGFLADAINNYVGIIGNSFAQEIMPLKDLAQNFPFESMSAAGRITYDLEKLRWVNKQWINRLSSDKLLAHCKPLLEQHYQAAYSIDDATLSTLLDAVKTELVTINDVVPCLEFYFVKPELTQAGIAACISANFQHTLKTIVSDAALLISNPQDYVSSLKADAKIREIPLKQIFWFLRLALMGKTDGPAIHELIDMLGQEEALKRIQTALSLI